MLFSQSKWICDIIVQCRINDVPCDVCESMFLQFCLNQCTCNHAMTVWWYRGTCIDHNSTMLLELVVNANIAWRGCQKGTEQSKPINPNPLARLIHWPLLTAGLRVHRHSGHLLAVKARQLVPIVMAWRLFISIHDWPITCLDTCCSRGLRRVNQHNVRVLLAGVLSNVCG